MRTLLVPVLLLGLLGCSSREEKEFMAGCRSGGVPRSLCSCIYQEIKPAVENAGPGLQFLQSDEFWTRYQRAALQCRDR